MLYFCGYHWRNNNITVAFTPLGGGEATQVKQPGLFLDDDNKDDYPGKYCGSLERDYHFTGNEATSGTEFETGLAYKISVNKLGSGEAGIYAVTYPQTPYRNPDHGSLTEDYHWHNAECLYDFLIGQHWLMSADAGIFEGRPGLLAHNINLGSLEWDYHYGWNYANYAQGPEYQIGGQYNHTGQTAGINQDTPRPTGYTLS